MLADAAENTVTGHPLAADLAVARPNTKSRPGAKKTGLPQVGNAERRTQVRVSKTERSRWESGDQYSGVLFGIPGTNWRVAVCAKGHCWMLQQREGRHRWISRKFFATKKRLAVVLIKLVGEQAFGAVKDKVDALPI